MNIKMIFKKCFISFRKLSMIFLLISIFVWIPLTTKADVMEWKDPDSGYCCLVADEANLLTEEQEKTLLEEMRPALEYGNIMFQSSQEGHGNSTQYFAEEKYKRYFGYESGTCFLIDMFQREIFIFSDGHNQKVLTTAKSNSVTDNCYKYASNGDYYTCASEGIKQIIAVLSGARINEPMKNISNAILAVLTGMIICAIIVMATMRVKKASNKAVLGSVHTNLMPAEVTIVKTNETKTYNGGSSGGSFGGGSSGGGFSGGGHSGGGGGHRF